MPALRRSHFPGPPAPTLRQPQLTSVTILRPVPDALDERRPAAGVKRSLLDTGEDRPSNSEAGTALLTQRGAMSARRPL